MNEPLVSLLLQSYNHARFLDLSVGSAIAQTWANKEIWVVDDGSTDVSHDLLSEWSRIEAFRYDRQANQGLIPTLNRMASESKGEFVALQATDDFWHLDKTRRQVEFLLEHPEIDICLTATVCVDEDGRRLGGASQQFLSPSPAGYGFEALFSGRTAVPGASALIRRSALVKQLPFDPAFPVEDLWLWLRMTHAGAKFAFLPDELSFYRLHGSNLHAKTAFMEREVLKILAQYSNHPSYPKAMRRWRAAYFSEWAVSDKREALGRLGSVSLREDQAWKGLAKLSVPSGLWKRWKRV